MDAIECIKTRMSIREFKPEPISKDVLMEIVNIAQHSPSYKNTQPWEVMIVSGSKKEALSKMMVDLLESGADTSPDLDTPVSWPDAEEGRIADLVKIRKEKFGIDFSDPEVIKQAKERNFNFYGAPHVIFLFQDSSLSDWSLFDLGLFAQSLMLAAHSKGVGTVPQAFVTDYAQDVKKFLAIPESKRLVLGLSTGYPVIESPANSVKTGRSDTDEIAKWVE